VILVKKSGLNFLVDLSHLSRDNFVDNLVDNLKVSKSQKEILDSPHTPKKFPNVNFYIFSALASKSQDGWVDKKL
jgi:hypothetical protein